jgi:hypothetical protein
VRCLCWGSGIYSGVCSVFTAIEDKHLVTIIAILLNACLASEGGFEPFLILAYIVNYGRLLSKLFVHASKYILGLTVPFLDAVRRKTFQIQFGIYRLSCLSIFIVMVEGSMD